MRTATTLTTAPTTNITNGTGAGIDMDDSYWFEIYENVITGNNWDGIYMDECGYGLIARNDISGNNDDGLDIYQSFNISVENNTFDENDDDGIEAEYSDNLTVEGNDFTNNGEDGIDIDNSDNISIIDNTVTGNDDDGCDLYDCPDVFIEDCTFNDNGENGLDIDECREVSVRNVVSDSNDCEGIRVWQSEDTTIEDSQISNNLLECEDTGIYVAYSTLYLKNGELVNNGDYGLLEDADAPMTVYWTIDDEALCQDNDIWIEHGWIVPTETGTLTKRNCDIFIGGEEVMTDGEVASALLVLETGEGNDTVANTTFGVIAETYTNSPYEGEIRIQVLDYNPGGAYSMEAFGKWVVITLDPDDIDLDYWILKIYYTDEELEASGIPEDELRIGYYNEDRGRWEFFDPPDGGVNEAENYVWARITHFSTFGVFGDEAPEEDKGRGAVSGYVTASPAQAPLPLQPTAPTEPVVPGEEEPCVEHWSCNDWLPEPCPPSGIQTRNCLDVKDCGTDSSKPDTTRPCDYVPSGLSGKATASAKPAAPAEDLTYLYILAIVIVLFLLMILLHKSGKI